MAILIFDYDGTLHDSMVIYEPCVRECQKMLAEQGLMEDTPIPRSQIESYLGLSAAEMWEQFAPGLSAEEKARGSRRIGEELSRRTREGQARLYDGAEEVLAQLKARGHELIFLSNCGEAYMNLHAQAFHLREYFSQMYCNEQFGWISKREIVQQLFEDRRGTPMISIGDRYKDMEIAQAGDVKTIWCAYGFGREEEGQSADETAHSVREIPSCVDRLCVSPSGLFPL